MIKWTNLYFVCVLFKVTAADETIFHQKASLDEKVLLHDPVYNADDKDITWYLNDTLIVQKQPGENQSIYDENDLYQLMNNGDLTILKMTLSLEGIYKRFINGHRSLNVDVRVKVEVTALKNTYKEKVVDALIHKEWNITFNISTRRVDDCKAEMDVMSLCFKLPTDNNTCTDLTNSTIIPKPGVCEAKISYNETANNGEINGLQYWVKFLPIDSFDHESIDSHSVNYQEFLLESIQAPSTEEDTIHPLTNPPLQTLQLTSVSATTQSPGQIATEVNEQLLKPSKTTNLADMLSMTNSVKSKLTQQPSTSIKLNMGERKPTAPTPRKNYYGYIAFLLVVLVPICFLIAYCVKRKNRSRIVDLPGNRSNNGFDTESGNPTLTGYEMRARRYKQSITE